MITQIEHQDEFELTLHTITPELIMEGSISDLIFGSTPEHKASEN